MYSYGEETASKYKYKTFFDTSSRSIDTSQDSEFSYSSSALYSQHSQHQQGVSGEVTYYLSALIESEDDEGVYQCINPFKPNYVIQNTTVLLSSKIFYPILLIYGFWDTYLLKIHFKNLRKPFGTLTKSNIFITFYVF